MAQRMSYLIDVSDITFAEGATPTSWIHAMTKGKYDHPLYGEIDFSDERLQRFADSVTKHVREIDPDIDYDHKLHSGDAAGWVKNAEVRSNGLWLFVEWTPTAQQKIKEKAYKYFSPEFVDEWEHPKTKTVHQDVLNGGAITNRPFLKDLSPLNLSELLNRADPPERKEMDPKKLAELLGLPEDATEEQILAKTKEFKEKAEKPTPPKDDDPELIKLAESNPVIKSMLERQKKLEEQAAITATALRLSEVKGNVIALNEHLRTKDLALPAPTYEALTKILHESPDAVGTQVSEMVKALGETGFVQLGELGSQRTKNNGGDPVKIFTEMVAKVRTDDKDLGYGEAVEMVARENPQAYQDYAEASYAGSIGSGS